MLPLPLMLHAFDLLFITSDQIKLRRGLSATYYALFHLVCEEFARVVPRKGPRQMTRAYTQVYRFIDHGSLKQRCNEIVADDRNKSALGFPEGVVEFARAVLELQALRIDADYNPTAWFNHVDASDAWGRASNAIDAFNGAPQQHRRAFVLYIALDRKRR
jgi:hypothetical protein